MIQNGSNREGRRVRAGDKPMPQVDEIPVGEAAKVLEAPDRSLIPFWSVRCFLIRLALETVNADGITGIMGDVLIAAQRVGRYRIRESKRK